jgi:hypothetical protein
MLNNYATKCTDRENKITHGTKEKTKCQLDQEGDQQELAL